MMNETANIITLESHSITFFFIFFFYFIYFHNEILVLFTARFRYPTLGTLELMF